VRTLGIEVVAGPVEVHREEVDGIEPVLLPVCLALDEEHLLGKAIWGVCLLGVTVPEVFLPEWDGGELRVGTDRPHNNALFDILLPGSLDDLDPHHRVVIEEGRRVLPVESNAADAGREVDDDIDTLHRVNAMLPLPEIGVPATGDPDLAWVHSPVRELLEHVRP